MWGITGLRGTPTAASIEIAEWKAYKKSGIEEQFNQDPKIDVVKDQSLIPARFEPWLFCSSAKRATT